MWNIDEFVEILNKKLPLKSMNPTGDARRSDVWTARMVKEYCRLYNIIGVKKGRFVFYDENNLSELSKNIVIKSLADNTSKLHSYSNSSFFNNNLIEGATKENNINLSSNSLKNIEKIKNNQSAIDILKDIKEKAINKDDKKEEDIINLLKSVKAYSEIKRTEGIKIKINENLEVVSNKNLSNEEIINQLKIWINKIGG